MVNAIKDICNKLDGFSSENQGYALTAFQCIDEESDIIITVKPYLKNEEAEGLQNHEHLVEMCNRLYSAYSDKTHYEVNEAVYNGTYWKLRIREIKTDEV